MLRAELGVGADRITIIWLGRNRIAGIAPGRALAVEGILSQQGGRRIMYNPRYDLGTEPAGRSRVPDPGT
jgi:hypothetical protein